MTNSNEYDIAIIGGGINGCGIAAQAAQQGLSVYLCEQADLANFTSSASSKLIHGGLRYLEHYEFRLVREALAEREVLLGMAPHLISPLSLVIPHRPQQRPRWLIRAGLFLYDHLGFRFAQSSSLAKSKTLNLSKHDGYAEPLQNDIKHAFVYTDCQVDDARLVIANAQLAKQYGAMICPRTVCQKAVRQLDHWQLQLMHQQQTQTIRARALVNAAGPWVDNVITHCLQQTANTHLQLVKGSHIVVPKLYQGDHAYLLQHDDKRVIFVIPYHHHYTMIGTTDILYQGDPAKATIQQEEIDYLCQIVNHYFKSSITADAIVNTWSGVRPLQADDSDNPSATTRDYELVVSDSNKQLPLLSIFGGKITTYRQLALHAMKKLSPYFKQLTENQTSYLPGGNIKNIPDFIQQQQQHYSFIPNELLQRWVFAYGSNIQQLLQGITQLSDLKYHFGHGLYQHEVDYLCKYEWAQTADDILWRRSKLGLSFAADQIEKLTAYLNKLNNG